MSLLIARLTAAFALFTVTVFLGLAPVILFKLYTRRKEATILTLSGSPTKKKSISSPTLQLFMFFGGGVLLATCFIHLIPEVRDNYQRYVTNMNPSSSFKFGHIHLHGHDDHDHDHQDNHEDDQDNQPEHLHRFKRTTSNDKLQLINESDVNMHNKSDDNKNNNNSNDTLDYFIEKYNNTLSHPLDHQNKLVNNKNNNNHEYNHEHKNFTDYHNDKHDKDHDHDNDYDENSDHDQNYDHEKNHDHNNDRDIDHNRNSNHSVNSKNDQLLDSDEKLKRVLLKNLTATKANKNSFEHETEQFSSSSSFNSHVHSHSHGVPYVELAICCGFFIIYFLEELIHLFISDHLSSDTASITSVPEPSPHLVSCRTKETYDNLGADLEIPPPKTGAFMEPTYPSLPYSVRFIRGLMTIIAFSAHSIFDGVAIGLQKSEPQIWTLMFAVGLHKLVVAFAIGIELFEKTSSLLLTSIHMILFSLMSPAGILLVIITEKEMDGGVVTIMLSATATGTILYIVFFEILVKDRCKVPGMALFAVMVIGFCVMSAIVLYVVH